MRQKKNFIEAELVTVEQAAPDRVDPRCPYFGRCGGCSYQHIRYERQLEIKANQVEETLRRIGRLSQVPMRAMIGAPEAYDIETEFAFIAAAV
jgi:23S rRNA (uracil1939-C5)-methyltransferase